MSQPLLGRCKDCDYTLFVSENQTSDIPEVNSFSEIKQPGVAYRVDNGIFARCDKKHRVFMLRHIKGTYSKDHKCDSRCLNARGWKCTCSCGGANHGRGYAVAVHDANQEKEERLLGTIGKHIVGKVKVTRVYEGGNASIYTFYTLDDTAKLTWFVPNYADPHFKKGEILTIRAKVKRHEDDIHYGKCTVVTYVEYMGGPIEVVVNDSSHS